VTTLVLPQRLLADAGAFFESCGTRGMEGTAMIKIGPAGPSLVIPDQQPWRSPAGRVSVEVTRAGQLQLALALAPDELFAARIHSHPAEAFHSPADDANPILVHEGALSIVVPFLGLGLRRGLGACAVLRRDQSGWRDLPPGPGRNRWIRCAPETRR
jgi:hypothetical protein